MFSESDLVFSYTIKDAVRDGVLIPVPGNISKDCRIKFPVYFNDSVWSGYVKALPEEDHTEQISDMLKDFTFCAAGYRGSILKFKIYLECDPSDPLEPNEQLCEDDRVKSAELKVVITAHDIDDPTPAIFIMLPWED